MKSQKAAIRQAENVAVIEAFVIERFIERDEESTGAEIAAGTGLSLAIVRRDVIEARGLQYRTEHRESRSRNYPGFVAGAHKVGVWGPTRRTLVRVIRELRHEKEGATA